MGIEIRESSHVPDTTYFRTEHAEPNLQYGYLLVLNGYGTRRASWGAPGVTSTVVVETPDFVAVHVGFHHKHGGGQFWRYYQEADNEIKRLLWKDLTEERRLSVLDAWVERAPDWAKCPGKLRSQYLHPGELARMEIADDGAPIGYKCLAQDADGSLRSPFAYTRPVWSDGQLIADTIPTMNNTNGIYAVKSRKDPELARYAHAHPDLVLVRLRLSGQIVEHEQGFRAEIADVLEVINGNR